MKLKTKSCHGIFTFKSEAGYDFTVNTFLDEISDNGWSANVGMSTRGFNSEEQAIKHLRYACKAFLDMTDEE